MNKQQIIREKAYQIYETRLKNNIAGTAENDWIMAELYYKYFSCKEIERSDKIDKRNNERLF